MPPKRRSASLKKRSTANNSPTRVKRTASPRAPSRGRSRSVGRTTKSKPTRSPSPKKAVAASAKKASTPTRRRSNSVGRKPTAASLVVSRSNRVNNNVEVPDLMKLSAYRFPDPNMTMNNVKAGDDVYSSARGRAMTTSNQNASKLYILVQMLACVAGIYFCFSMWSLKQERLMTMPYSKRGDGGKGGEFFPTVFGVSTAQSIAGFLVALVLITAKPTALSAWDRVLGRHISRPSSSSSPLSLSLDAQDVRAMAMVGFATAFGATLGYAGMRRLSFPVVLATKMSKMVPVMVVGFLCYGTRHSWRKVLSCALITVGIMGFYLLEDTSAKPGHGRSASADSNSSAGLVGFLLLFLNLFLDGFANSTQDVLVRRHGWNGTVLMLTSNLSSALWGAATMLVLESPPLQCVLTAVLPSSVASHFAFGDLSRTLAFLRAYPAARNDLLVMSLLNAIGQIFIFQTITLFGTLTLTAMTLVRKAGSVLLSIFINGHSVSKPQWAALLLVMVSVVFEAHVNIAETAEKRKLQNTKEGAESSAKKLR